MAAAGRNVDRARGAHQAVDREVGQRDALAGDDRQRARLREVSELAGKADAEAVGAGGRQRPLAGLMVSVGVLA